MWDGRETLQPLTTQPQFQSTGPLLFDLADPGKAMLSSKWTDIGKTKGPMLRGLAARAPYFHNGLRARSDGGGRLLQRPIRHRAHVRTGERPGRVLERTVAARPSGLIVAAISQFRTTNNGPARRTLSRDRSDP